VLSPEECALLDTWLGEFDYDSAGMKPANFALRASGAPLERRTFVALVTGGLLGSLLAAAVAQPLERCPG